MMFAGLAILLVGLGLIVVVYLIACAADRRDALPAPRFYDDDLAPWREPNELTRWTSGPSDAEGRR